MDKSVFSKFVARIKKEGILKSLLYGLINGFAVNFLILTVCYILSALMDNDTLLLVGLWLSIGLGLAVGLSTGLVLYYKKFRPTTKRVAERVDGLGLEERAITMLEFENDESYIAMKQREDAKKKLDEVDTQSIKFNFAKSTIIAASVLTVIGLAMTTLGVLTNYNIIKPPLGPLDSYEKPYMEVQYLTEGDGTVVGYDPESNSVILEDPEQAFDYQIVIFEEDAKPVFAMPDEGWAFVGWKLEDGNIDENNSDPVRQELAVKADLIITAVFQVPQDTEQGSAGSSDDEPPEDDDEPPAPPDENAPPSQNFEESDEPGENNPSEDNPGNIESNGNGDPSDTGSGSDRYAESSKYLNGETAYQDDYDSRRDDGERELLDNPNLTDEQRAIGESYLNNLGAGVDTGNTDGSKSDN